MAKDNCTLGVEYQTLTPIEFINEMIATGVAQTRDEAISLAVFNGRPVLNRRSWDRVCYEGGKASEGTLLKLTIIFQVLTRMLA